MLDMLRGAAGPEWRNASAAEILAHQLTPLVTTAYRKPDDVLARALVVQLRDQQDNPDVRAAAADRNISLPVPARSAEASGLALEVLTLALRHHEAAGNRPGQADVLNSLGNHLGKRGDHHAALAHLRRATAISDQLVEESPDIFSNDHALTLSNLVGSLIDNGAAEEAVAYARRSVAILQASEAADAGDVETQVQLSGSLINLTNALAELGRSREAIPHATRAVEILERAAAEDAAHRATYGQALHNLSAFYAASGEPRRAAGRLRKVIAVRRELSQHDPIHRRGLGRSLALLAEVLSETGRELEAVEYAEEAVEWYEQLAAEDVSYYPGLADRLLELAVLYVDTGSTASALPIQQRLVDIYEALCADDHDRYIENLAASYELLAKLYDMLGKHRRARKIRKQLP